MKKIKKILILVLIFPLIVKAEEIELVGFIPPKRLTLYCLIIAIVISMISLLLIWLINKKKK